MTGTKGEIKGTSFLLSFFTIREDNKSKDAVIAVVIAKLVVFL